MNTPSPLTLQKMQAEHSAWIEMVNTMHDAGMITGIDKGAPMSRRDTPGMRVLALIRAWGASIETMRMGIESDKRQPQSLDQAVAPEEAARVAAFDNTHPSN